MRRMENFFPLILLIKEIGDEHHIPYFFFFVSPKSYVSGSDSYTAPHGFWWYCSKGFMETCRKMDEINTGHGKKAPSGSGSVFNINGP